MAVCPIHGVDHDLEGDESSIQEQLEAQQAQLFKALTSFPLDHPTVEISDQVTVHFLPNNKVTEDMRRDVVSTLRNLEELNPSTTRADVYFPVPGETILDMNPELGSDIKDPNGNPVPRQFLVQFLKEQPDGQTFHVIRFNLDGTPDAEKTLLEGDRILFLYEGLINAERKDPYDYEELGKDSVIRQLATMLQLPTESQPPKRAKYMYLAWSIFTPLIYRLVHEWGHVLDRRSQDERQELVDAATRIREAFVNDLSFIAFEGGDKETFGEAYVEWVATNGATENVVAKTYAKVYHWPIFRPEEAWDFPHDVRDFRAEPTIKIDEVADNNPYSTYH